ncbi:MAG: methylated-DNA--[protein]-cysteine S-methyltransferase [Eubacteriales bacterium]
MYYAAFNTPLCKMMIAGDETGVSLLQLDIADEPSSSFSIGSNWENNSSFFDEEIHQILDYLRGDRKSFDIVANPHGTAFQHQVWEAVLDIPYGKTTSVGDIAQKLHHPDEVGAVGQAGAKNPIPIIIPCHRVIGTDMCPQGFSLDRRIKERLIELEKGH